jgi:sulfate permease, SulP family
VTARADQGRTGRRAALLRLLPFLGWFPLPPGALRADLIAGIAGALVLVPKAMAYAQLSGLPVHYGLYVALVPAVVGALWGSSAQLATGPVAVVSLMTAAALAPLAVPFSSEYIELALLLTLMVGLIQLALGTLKLGQIVNFVSHPAILGFMNAAAVIIGLSQLDLLLGLPKGRTGSFLGDTWEALRQLHQAHWPTLGMALFALGLMLAIKRIRALAQLGVLIAVIATTLLSVAIGYEREARAGSGSVADEDLRGVLERYLATEQRVALLQGRMPQRLATLRSLEAQDRRAAQALRHEIALDQLELRESAEAQAARWRRLSQVRLQLEPQAPGGPAVLRVVPEGAGAGLWRIRKVDGGQLHLSAGGDVVGSIPRGLPSFHAPAIDLQALLALLPAALAIALVGFMESVAMAKALATKTRQRLHPNQELLGQGAANLAGSFFQSYPACGSFTGSAINLQAGARTGMAMIFNGLFVAATLLALTPLLYHLPKATLGAIILLAVASLVTPAALQHTWRASRVDGLVALATFLATLAAAPHLDRGIAFGAALAVSLYLLRTMKPRLVVLGRHPDGALRDVQLHPGAATTPEILALRFDDTLFFANAAFFEEQVIEAVAQRPQVSFVLLACGGINRIDSTGEEVVRRLVAQLRAGGLQVVFSGVKRPVLEVLERTGAAQEIGRENLFPGDDDALEAIYRRLGRGAGGEMLRRAPAGP